MLPFPSVCRLAANSVAIFCGPHPNIGPTMRSMNSPITRATGVARSP